MNFEDYYLKTPENQKMNFLDAIISENKEMQKAFINFISAEKTKTSEISFSKFTEIIKKTHHSYKENFESVDLENPDWESYNSSSYGYREEWEIYQEASEQEFETIFGEFYDEAMDLIIRQKVVELTAMLTGLFQAAQDADVPDPLNSFEDVNTYLADEFEEILINIIEKIKLSAISENTILQASEYFFKYCDKVTSEKEHYAAAFEDFFMALAGKTNQPEKLLTDIDSSSTDRKFVPRLVLMLIKMTGNSGDWLQSAGQYYKENNDVAAQLLDYYFENDRNEFIRLASELFDRQKYHWAEPLSKMVTPDLNQELFVKVFYQLVTDNNLIEDYQKLRPWLTDELLEKLLSEISNKPFKVSLLAIEKRYEEIKEIVERNPDDWSYTELIRPILAVYPEFCFNHIKQKVLRTLKNERGRSTYQRITEWLQTADTIPGFKAENRILARELYNHKPALPALKDELRKGGVV